MELGYRESAATVLHVASLVVSNNQQKPLVAAALAERIRPAAQQADTVRSESFQRSEKNRVVFVCANVHVYT